MQQSKKLAGGFEWNVSTRLTEGQHSKRICAVVLPAMVLPFFGALLYFVLTEGEYLTQIAYSGTKLFTFVWPVIAVVCILKHGIKWPALREIRHWKTLPSGILIGAGIVGLMFLLMQTQMLGGQIRASVGNMQVAVGSLGLNQSNYWFFGVFLAVLHSLLEEYYWRWFVFGGLHQMVSPGLAHGLAGAAFMGHHVVVLLQFFPVPLAIFLSLMIGVGGMIWSWMYLRQASLLGAWIAHMIVDFGILWIGYQLLFGAA
ncbi:MAG: type II CAAX endopeptidase family protein [Verrucomicrobiota bacterium]|nr:CPBP family intramembrane metalloprotease [Pedosphaera sp.]MEE2942262.1 type II CAAX endopeptidase family protein [Verrucomicrobiota bacterium]|tara:strand:- start:2037 stop:2807 length:771 start_codon:yes stop_codon:yes gene_type:complete